MKTLELLKDLNINIGEEVSDFLQSGHDNISDYCHESADSSENVIYYAKAEQLYHAASTIERDGAEQMVEDCGGFGEAKAMSDRFTLLAYWITYNREMESLSKELETLKDDLEEAMEVRANREKWGVMVEEMIETLENA